ncbi:MAG: TIGR02147 family protein [Myxococcota bacterium]
MRAPDPEPAPDLFGYLNFREYLRSWFAWKKKKNPRYSYRLFARLTGQRSPSLLLHIMEGKRNLTAAMLEGYQNALQLNDEERAFFEALVTLDQGGTPQARNQAWEQIAATQRFRRARRLDAASFRRVSRWHYTAILELARSPQFQPDPIWMAAALEPPIAVEDAEQALQELLELGLLEAGPDGIHPAEISVTTPHEVAGLAGFNYHEGMLSLAREAIIRVPPSQRHLVGLTVGIPAALVPRLKRELTAFAERLLDLCDSNDDAVEIVYQIGMQAFPLSRAFPVRGEE